MLEACGVQREGFPGGLDLSLLHPGPFQRVLRFILQREHPVIEQTVIRLSRPGRREVDVPFTVRIMDFRSPYIGAERSRLILAPGDRRLRRGQLFQRACPPDFDPVIFRNRCGEIIIAINMFIDPRICALLNQRIVEFGVRHMRLLL
ncbi:hypothetical protein D3C71_1481710 [compost metagenome]